MIYDTPPSLLFTAITIYHPRAKAGEHGGQFNNCNSAFTAIVFGLIIYQCTTMGGRLSYDLTGWDGMEENSFCRANY